MSKKVHVKTGDTVIVINGKDRGKTGKVMQVSPSEGLTCITLPLLPLYLPLITTTSSPVLT